LSPVGRDAPSGQLLGQRDDDALADQLGAVGLQAGWMSGEKRLVSGR
jgi:hypothetical protein